MAEPAPSSSATDPTPRPRVESVSWFLRWRRPLIVGAHLASFILSMFLAFLFVHSMHLDRRWMVFPFPILLLVAVPIKIVVFGCFRQYRGWWRYVGIADLVDIAKGAVLSALLIIILWYMHCNRIIPSYRWMNGDEIQAEFDDILKQTEILRQQLVINPDEELIRQRLSLAKRRYNLQGMLDLVNATQYNDIRRQLMELRNTPFPPTNKKDNCRSKRSKPSNHEALRSARSRWPSKASS